MIGPDEFEAVGNVVNAALLFGIFYRMGVFTSSISAFENRLKRIEQKGNH